MTSIVNVKFTLNNDYCSACGGRGLLPVAGPVRPGETMSKSLIACPRCRGQGFERAAANRDG
jgi:hypothetical protein